MQLQRLLSYTTSITHLYDGYAIKDSHVAIKWLPSPWFPPASSLTASYVPKCTACAGPAPTMTEDTPRHNARIPSVDDIRVKAFPIPEYMAAGEAAKTCIRVYMHWLRLVS